MFGPKVASRFWAKVCVSVGCWNWTAYLNKQGYGRLRVGQTMVEAHRVSYALHFGPIPDTLHVLHRCDNPSCVNPAHLFLGTNNDNVQDKMQKGRYRHRAVRGEEHGHAKLNEQQVLDIRASTLPQAETALLYGVSQSLIGMIKAKKRWAHVG